MNEKPPNEFKRCYTCNRWLPLTGAYSDRFCSRECAQSFHRCPVCGDYFEASTLTEDGFCSAACAAVDSQDKAETMTELED